MASSIRLVSPNELLPPVYPDHVILKGKAIEYFVRLSPLFDTFDEIAGRPNQLVLDSELFMEGDPTFWKLMVDFLFPYEVPRKYPSHQLFIFTPDGNYYINPLFNVTIDKLREVIDYLNIGHSRDMDALITHFVYDRPGAPEQTKNAHRVNVPPKEQTRPAFQTQQPTNSNAENRWNNNGYSVPNENNVEIGFRNEAEEEAYGKMSAANYARFKPQGGKINKSKTRKLKPKRK